MCTFTIFLDPKNFASFSGSCDRFARSERDKQPPEASGGGHRKIDLSLKPIFESNYKLSPRRIQIYFILKSPQMICYFLKVY